MPLEIQVRSAPPLDLVTDVLVVGVLQGGGKATSLAASLKTIDNVLGGALGKAIAKEEFTGKRDQALSLTTLGKLGADKLVILGLGDRRVVHAPEMRVFAAKAARAAVGDKAKSLTVALPAGLEGHLRAVAEGLELGAYPFTKYLTGARRPQTYLPPTTILVAARPKSR